jgi:hypothetical protein
MSRRAVSHAVRYALVSRTHAHNLGCAALEKSGSGWGTLAVFVQRWKLYTVTLGTKILAAV